MADDDEKPHDWDPDRERRQTDPVEQAKAVAKAFAEEARRQQQIDRSREASAPPIPMDLQIGIHKISNGYVVLQALTPIGYANDRSGVQETFAADSAEVHVAILKLLQEFFEGKLTRNRYGTPPGPFIGGVGPGLGSVEG